MFQNIKCPHCGHKLTVFITEYKGNKVVLDACPKCGKKTTEEQEVINPINKHEDENLQCNTSL